MCPACDTPYPQNTVLLYRNVMRKFVLRPLFSIVFQRTQLPERPSELSTLGIYNLQYEQEDSKTLMSCKVRQTNLDHPTEEEEVTLKVRTI